MASRLNQTNGSPNACSYAGAPGAESRTYGNAPAKISRNRVPKDCNSKMTTRAEFRPALGRSPDRTRHTGCTSSNFLGFYRGWGRQFLYASSVPSSDQIGIRAGRTARLLYLRGFRVVAQPFNSGRLAVPGAAIVERCLPPAETLAVLPGVGQSSASPLPQNLLWPRSGSVAQARARVSEAATRRGPNPAFLLDQGRRRSAVTRQEVGMAQR